MIGQAIHKILKNQISDLNSGGVFPIIMPQNSKYSLSSASSYPAVIYHQMIDLETTKDKSPNMVKCDLSIQVISKSYKTTAKLSKKIKNVLDNYRDLSKSGLDVVQGYQDRYANNHSFIENVDISNVFFSNESDDYFEDLRLYTRAVDYQVYFYWNINQFSYSKGKADTATSISSFTNPLILSLDLTQVTSNSRSALVFSALPPLNVSNATAVQFLYNKIGNYYAQKTPTDNIVEYDPYLRCTDSDKPEWFEGTTTPAYAYFSGTKNFRTFKNPSYDPISLAYGALLIYVYKPIKNGGNNFLAGNNVSASEEGNIAISHAKIGINITIEFNPCGNNASYASRTISLKTSTDSNRYWDADIHFLALSLGGNKAQTGGTKNNSGWYEYFNNNHNPKLTTGQILQANSFTGNSDTYSNSLTFAGIGSEQDTSLGFGVYEMLLFVPESSTGDDTAPFRPTDIIYKKIKDYIYNKYESLNI
jgi:hypothetical protein